MLDWPRAQFYNLFSYLLAHFWWSQSVTPWHLPNEYHCSKLPLSWSPAVCWTSSLETLISIWIPVYPKPYSPSSVTTHFLRSFHRLCFDNFTVCVAEGKNFAVVLDPSFFQAPHEIHNQCLSWALPSKHTQNVSTSRSPPPPHPVPTLVRITITAQLACEGSLRVACSHCWLIVRATLLSCALLCGCPVPALKAKVLLWPDGSAPIPPPNFSFWPYPLSGCSVQDMLTSLKFLGSTSMLPPQGLSTAMVATLFLLFILQNGLYLMNYWIFSQAQPFLC